MSDEFEPVHQPTTDQILSSLDGSVQSQGVKVSHREWLDMGSEEWGTTPDHVKAAAYQAAHVTGWHDARLAEIMIGAYVHLNDFMMGQTIEILRELSEKHPLNVEGVNEQTADVKITRSTQTDLSEAEAK